MHKDTTHKVSNSHKVVISGIIGRNPDVLPAKNGMAPVGLFITVQEIWLGHHCGERLKRTRWHHLVIRKAFLCHYAMDKLKKGMQAYAECSVETRTFTDHKGDIHSRNELVVQRLLGEAAQSPSSATQANPIAKAA